MVPTMKPSCLRTLLLLTGLSLHAGIQGLTTAPALADEKPAQSPSPDDRPKLHRATVERLRGFVVVARQKDITNDALLKALNDLSQQVKDEHLATVETFALTEEAKPATWAFARILVERNRYDGAADVIVTSLLSEKKNRGYSMWKRWEYFFGEREDYKEMSRQ